MAKVKGTATATANKGNGNVQTPETAIKNEVAKVKTRLCQAVNKAETANLEKSTVFQQAIMFNPTAEMVQTAEKIKLPAGKIANDLTWLGHTSNQKNTLLDSFIYDFITNVQGKKPFDFKPLVNAVITGTVNEASIKGTALKHMRQRTLDHGTKKRSGNQWLGCAQWLRAKNTAMKSQRDKVHNINDIAKLSHIGCTRLAELLAIKAEIAK